MAPVKETITTKSDRHFNKLDIYDPSSFKVVKKISLDEKIAFWNETEVANEVSDHKLSGKVTSAKMASPGKATPIRFAGRSSVTAVSILALMSS